MTELSPHNEEEFQEDFEPRAKRRRNPDNDKMMVSKFMNPSFLADFILKYRNSPCLWQTGSKDYHNRTKRDVAMQELLEFTQKTIPEATVDFLRKRIDNVRSCFRRELAKVQASKLSGVGPEDVYQPKLWYYESMEFIASLPKANSWAYLPTNEDDNVELELEEENEEEEQILCIPKTEIMESSSQSSCGQRLTQGAVFRGQTTSSEAQKEKASTSMTEAQRLDEELDAVGKSVAAKLKKMKTMQRVHAEKLISDVLYMGLLGKLAESNVASGTWW